VAVRSRRRARTSAQEARPQVMDARWVQDVSDEDEMLECVTPDLWAMVSADAAHGASSHTGDAATSTSGADSAGAPAPSVARVGLQLSPSQHGGIASRGLCWRDGRFSDWTVRVGEKTYHLHAFLLARASLFFESHMSITSRAEASVRGSDLTEVLPQSCHAAFEDALDFIYSENQAGFEAPASKALLLLKIADILGICTLFEAMGQRIEVAFSETAPLLLEQYCRFHIPGTDDGAALRQIREGAVELIVRKFQPFLATPEMRTALLRLPAAVLGEILEADDLLVANEDVVFDFVVDRLEASPDGATPESTAASCSGSGSGTVSGSTADFAEPRSESSTLGDDEVLWQRVRWAHLSASKFAQVLKLQPMLRPEVTLFALTARAARLDLGGAEAFGCMSSSRTPQASPGADRGFGSSPAMSPSFGFAEGAAAASAPPRQPILPPGVPPPTSTEIDFSFHYARADQYGCGEALRSQPKRIGDAVLRVLVFPAGTDTGVARGSLSVFLEAVPQPCWPRDWEFVNVRYAISCVRWPTGTGETWNAKRKSDLWTFKANRLDRGWHDFLAPGEIHRFLGPDGFVCIRGSLEPECLGRTFLLTSQAGNSAYPGGPGGEAAGSSASRRSWALPSPLPGVGPGPAGGPVPPLAAPHERAEQ